MNSATSMPGKANGRPKDSRRRLWRRPLGWTDPVVRLMVLALPLAKLLGIATVHPSTPNDTNGYRSPGTWLDFSLTSLDGMSPRPWGATIWLAVSYTHLTLPTILRVSISVVAVSLKTK